MSRGRQLLNNSFLRNSAGAEPESEGAFANQLRIDAVYDHSGRVDSYTSGGLFKVTGRGFGEFAEVPDHIGLYLLAAQQFAHVRPKRNSTREGGYPVAGRDIRRVPVFRYIRWSDTEIDGVWPVAARGPQHLVIELRDSTGSPLIASHQRLLLP